MTKLIENRFQKTILTRCKNKGGGVKKGRGAEGMGMRRSGVSGHNTIGYRELSELQGNSEIFTKDKKRGWGARGMKVVGGDRE